MDESLGAVDDGAGALRALHADLGASFETVGGVEAVAHYDRRERTLRAVRRGVGVTHAPADVVVLEGADRHEYLDNVLTNPVPTTEGQGGYALLLDPQGRIEADFYVFDAGERLLLLAPPGVAEDVVAGWETFIQDVEIRLATEAFAVFGVHGPMATEKVASVLNGAATPEERLSFVRGSMDDAGVSVVRTDAPAGEVGYDVVCAAADARDVFDTLLNRGANAVPFGRETWRALTLEAGTPLFDPELDGRLPNVLGLADAVDYEKGCFVGQEVVSKVRNRGRPSRRLVGLALAESGSADPLPEAGAAVDVDGESVGEVTRVTRSPHREATVALALVEYDLAADAGVAVETGGGSRSGTVVGLPFVEGSERSARIPTYED